jgi:hypothetical protein
MSVCPTCGSQVSAIADRCSTCGADAGAPNVRALMGNAEVAALNERYQCVLTRAESLGITHETETFKFAIERSSAIINCELSFLRQFVTSPSLLYANYHRGVLAGVRRAAEGELDRDRVITDAILFGSYYDKITMAALSLSYTGLSSYGPYSIKLREIAISRRTTLLEENSFPFISHHKLSSKMPIPLGYRSTWADRAKLAVAKLGNFILPRMTEADFQGLLLSDTGDRSKDEFIEIHIFGTFDRDAIDTVTGPKPKKRNRDLPVWEVVKEHLKTLERSFHEL